MSRFFNTKRNFLISTHNTITMAMTTASSAIHTQIWIFPKLKGSENYHPWAKKMRSALNFSGYWDIVEKGRGTYPEDTYNQTPAQRAIFDGLVNAWNEKNNQAAELIYSMCEEKPGEGVEDEPTAGERWKILEKNYMSSGWTLKFARFEELWAIHLGTSNNSVEAYVSNMLSKSKELKKMGEPVSNDMLVALLLNNLDGRYNDLRHRLQVQEGQKAPEFDTVSVLLREEERLHKKQTKEQALSANWKKFNKDQEEKKKGSSNNNKTNDSGNKDASKASSNPKSNNYKGEGKPPECPLCPPRPDGTKKLHWPLFCWTLHKDKIPPWHKDSKSKANKASETPARPADFVDSHGTHISALAFHTHLDKEEVSYEDFWGLPETPEEKVEKSLNLYGQNDVSLPDSPLLPAVDEFPHESSMTFRGYAANVGEGHSSRDLDWLIDSGCTNHMFFDEEQFNNYRVQNSGVLIANGTTVAVIGRETIEMEWLLPNGSSSLIRLDDVLHVPDITCGLFSIS